MAQFRLTKKFATDLKVKQLESPAQETTRFDDWVIDVIRIHRKKVAMVTHVKSLLTFLLPYVHLGGAEKMPDCISSLIKGFLNDNGLVAHDKEIDQIFLAPPVFCKTDNRKVLGHMNDFRRCINVEACDRLLSLENMHWNGRALYSVNYSPIGSRWSVMDLAITLFSGSGIDQSVLSKGAL